MIRAPVQAPRARVLASFVRAAVLPAVVALGPWSALAAQAPAGRVSPAQEVRGVFNLLVAAANRVDADGEAGFFWRSAELISVAQGTPTLGWESRDGKTRQWYGALASQKIEPLQVEVRQLAPDVVSLMATMRQEIAAKDGRSWKGEGVWSLVFRRLKGEWKVVYEHYSYEK